MFADSVVDIESNTAKSSLSVTSEPSTSTDVLVEGKLSYMDSSVRNTGWELCNSTANRNGFSIIHVTGV